MARGSPENARILVGCAVGGSGWVVMVRGLGAGEEKLEGSCSAVKEVGRCGAVYRPPA